VTQCNYSTAPLFPFPVSNSVPLSQPTHWSLRLGRPTLAAHPIRTPLFSNFSNPPHRRNQPSQHNPTLLNLDTLYIFISVPSPSKQAQLKQHSLKSLVGVVGYHVGLISLTTLSVGNPKVASSSLARDNYFCSFSFSGRRGSGRYGVSFWEGDGTAVVVF
jgi:hypothetical protein